MGRKHRYSLNAQRPPVYDVVVIAFHGNQFAFSDRRDHAASARAEVTGSCELADICELQLLGGSLYCCHIEESTKPEPDATADCQLQPFSTVNSCQTWLPG